MSLSQLSPVPFPARNIAAEPQNLPARLADTPQQLQPVRSESKARGFVFYVGLDESKANTHGTSLHQIVQALRATTAGLAPTAETHTAVALAPAHLGGRDVDMVRLALQDPAAIAANRGDTAPDTRVIIDLSRNQVLIHGKQITLSYKEFELLAYLVQREGATVPRQDLISSLWTSEEDAPNARTIDVHVRRLRAKLGGYEGIVRTVRGAGYRFDEHADVTVTS